MTINLVFVRDSWSIDFAIVNAIDLINFWWLIGSNQWPWQLGLMLFVELCVKLENRRWLEIVKMIFWSIKDKDNSGCIGESRCNAMGS